MTDWRGEILREFPSQVARLTLVADPDGLLLEEGILQGLRGRGFELVTIDDHVAFRYAYESKFRARWDIKEDPGCAVVIRYDSADLSVLPYDIMRAGRKISFSLGQLFPTLSYPVVASLERDSLDALYTAQIHHSPGTLGANATKDFVLRHVFEIAPELIKQPSDLLRVLLRRHYRAQRVPSMLDDRFIHVLRQTKLFEGWPLEIIIPDLEAFFEFLQERWAAFVERVSQDGSGTMRSVPHAFSVPGPTDLPFEHDDIRVYVDNLFLDGLLRPISPENIGALTKAWAMIGIRTDPEADRTRRLRGLLESVKGAIPGENAWHDDWLHFALRWAELNALYVGWESGFATDISVGMEALRTEVDRNFAMWVQERYAGLVNMPPVPPVMLHHVPRALARHATQSQERRQALLVIDGLALDQWITVRDELLTRHSNLRFRENAIFAWIPTVTSVSRQATFAGKLPLYFPSSIYTTSKEPALWTQFWMEQGLGRQEVEYARITGDEGLEQVDEVLADTRIRILGLVICQVDSMMHGMTLGLAGMHSQLREWTRRGFLGSLLNSLLDHKFSVCMVSDHGNIEAIGCGQPTEGAVADLRGERMRVYSNTVLRKEVKDRFPASVEWPCIGLPSDYLPLLAPERLAFLRVNDRLVVHGGAAIEEVVVPLIQVERVGT